MFHFILVVEAVFLGLSELGPILFLHALLALRVEQLLHAQPLCRINVHEPTHDVQPQSTHVRQFGVVPVDLPQHLT